VGLAGEFPMVSVAIRPTPASGNPSAPVSYGVRAVAAECFGVQYGQQHAGPDTRASSMYTATLIQLIVPPPERG